MKRPRFKTCIAEVARHRLFKSPVACGAVVADVVHGLCMEHARAKHLDAAHDAALKEKFFREPLAPKALDGKWVRPSGRTGRLWA